MGEGSSHVQIIWDSLGPLITKGESKFFLDTLNKRCAKSPGTPGPGRKETLDSTSDCKSLVTFAL